MTNGDFYMVSIQVDRALELLVGLRRACRVCDVRDVEPSLDGLVQVVWDVRAILEGAAERQAAEDAPCPI